jgi:arylsulfatase A-like enzyme
MSGASGTPQAGVPASWPNVLIILVDDMGYGDPHCFNPQSKIATPNIDKLAAEGMKFTDAHAGASICVPSRYSILTGRMPYRNWNTTGVKGVRKESKKGREMIHFPQPQLQAEPGRLNLATLMKRQGYATACVGKWHQGMSTKAEADGTLKMSPVDFGFDYYFGFDAPEQAPYAFIENKRFVVAPTETIEDHPGEGVTNPETQGAHWRKGPAAPGWKFDGYLSSIAGKANAWLEKQTHNRPFFFYYAIPAPHAPWATASEFKGKSSAGQYGDYVMNVDAMIGQVMTTLDKLKLRDNTLIVFSSDNGPVWYPHDIEKFDHRAAGPWKGMKGDLTDAGHHMPFIASWPGKIEAGSSCGELICFSDMMATIAALLGEKLPNDAGEDSFDILPLLRGEKPATPIRHGMVHVNYGSYTLAIRDGDWKLILPSWIYTVKDGTILPDTIVETKGKGPNDKFQLYNLRTDPSETTNVFMQEPDKARELFTALKADIARGRSR